MQNILNLGLKCILILVNIRFTYNCVHYIKIHHIKRSLKRLKLPNIIILTSFFVILFDDDGKAHNK